MRIHLVGLIAAALSSALQAQPADTSRLETSKVLLVYDKVDSTSRFYIETLRQQLSKTGIPFDETAVDTTGKADISPYDCLVVYSQVMAFTMIAPVKKWLRSLGDLQGKRILIFVTANRWFADKQRKDLAKFIAKRNGTVVDAVSMATSRKSPEQRVQWMQTPLEKLGH